METWSNNRDSKLRRPVYFGGERTTYKVVVESPEARALKRELWLWRAVYDSAVCEVQKGALPDWRTHDLYMNSLINVAEISGDVERVGVLEATQQDLMRDPRRPGRGR